jgi:hypothetical protein
MEESHQGVENMKHFRLILISLGIILIALSVLFNPVSSEKEASKSLQERVIYQSDGFYENLSSYLSEQLMEANDQNFYLTQQLRSEYSNNYDLQSSLEKLQNKLGYLPIAENVSSSHSYDPFLFNCQSFSNELVQKLREAGYDASISLGYLKNDYCTYENLINFNCRHEWVTVRIPIEAITGEIISNQDFLNYYGEVN